MKQFDVILTLTSSTRMQVKADTEEEARDIAIANVSIEDRNVELHDIDIYDIGEV